MSAEGDEKKAEAPVKLPEIVPPKTAESAPSAGEGNGNMPFGYPIPGTEGVDGTRDPQVEAVLACVHGVFKAFSDSDTAAFSHFVDAECRFVRTGFTEDGVPDVTSYPKEYFLATLEKTKRGVLTETIEQPFVQMRDNLIAHVWCRYQLSVGGAPKYRGVKSLQLRNTPSGWKLVNVCDTVDS